MSETDKPTRIQQQTARRLQKDLEIKYTKALRVIRNIRYEDLRAINVMVREGRRPSVVIEEWGYSIE